MTMHTNYYLTSDYQNFIALSRYARWKDAEQRREGWLETVERYFNYLENYIKDYQTFIQNLSIEIVPIVSGGLIRAEDVIGGEEIFVAGYPLGSMVSDSMR